MRVIAGTFSRKPSRKRELASAGPPSHEGARYSFITWGNFATFVVGCTIVGTALFLGSRLDGPP
jgi:hypothetical protein